MEKKNPTVGTILGFFILGLPYSGGMKKGLIALVALCIVSSAIASLGMPLEHNAAIDGQGTDAPTTL